MIMVDGNNDTRFLFDHVHAITCHDARIIVPLIPKCMNTSLLVGWRQSFAVDDLTQPEHPTSTFQAAVHAPGTVPTITRAQARVLCAHDGYIIVAVIRDPMDRLISFYLNKGRYLVGGEDWDWIIRRGRTHPVMKLPRWFGVKSSPSTSRAFGQSLSQATFRQFVMELSVAFEAARQTPKVWSQMNKHITPYSRVIRYLNCDNASSPIVESSQLVLFDLQRDLAGLSSLLVTRGIDAPRAAGMVGTRVNVNPKGQVVVADADRLRPDALPIDMAYASLKAPDLASLVRHMYSEDYELLARCINCHHHHPTNNPIYSLPGGATLPAASLA